MGETPQVSYINFHSEINLILSFHLVIICHICRVATGQGKVREFCNWSRKFGILRKVREFWNWSGKFNFLMSYAQ